MSICTRRGPTLPADPTASRIPVGSLFSPNLISLSDFIAAVVRHSGDKASMEKAVWASPVRIKPVAKPPTKRQSSLPLEAAVQYGLLTSGDYRTTTLAQELHGLKGQPLFDRFARHVLLDCGGLRVVEAVQQMQADDLKITGDSLAEYLTAQGFRVTVHNTAVNTMRMWLARAGIFPVGRARAWAVDESAKARILGLDDDQILTLAGLSPAQAAFVEGLCVLRPEGWVRASEVRDWAETFRGVSIGRGSLPKEVLKALQESGLIEYRTGGTQSGKASHMRVTDKFDRKVLMPFVKKTIRDLDASVSAYYRKRPEDIYAGLESSDGHVKGQALEAFAIFVMRLMGLRFVGWRKRAEAEVDALLEGVLGPVATRWQVQCKNTPSTAVRLEDVAKEVGLLPLTRATHILFVANSMFSDDARRYARNVMKSTPVGVYLVDRRDFQALRSTPEKITAILKEQSASMLGIGRPDIFKS